MGAFGERMGFSSILSAMFRTCAKGGRSDGNLPLAIYICTFQVLSLRPLDFLLPQAHTVVCLLSVRCIHVCVCACHICLHIQAFTHACVPGRGASPYKVTQTHRLTQSYLPTCGHADRTHGHTDAHRQTRTHSQKEKTSNIALFISVFHLQNPMVNPGS